MSSRTTDTRETVKQYLNAFNDREWETLSGLLADDVVEHDVHDTLRGPDEVVEFLKEYFEIFPDYSGETRTMMVEDDMVAVRYTASGTHSDEYESVEPTGNKVEWTGMSMYRVEDGRIAEVWVEEDRLGLLERLEVVDPPAHLRL